MLVLSRKEGERVLIGEDIVITVNRIAGNRITLGIEAPRDVRVMRGELEPAEMQGLSLVIENCGEEVPGSGEPELPLSLAARIRSRVPHSSQARK